jgi:hypothetical protein
MRYERGLPFDRYLATDAVSASSMKAYLRSPLHYRHQIETPSKPSPAQIDGTIIHAVVLEPVEARSRYAIWEAGTDRRTKRGKEAYAEFAEVNEGRIIITSDQWDTAHLIRDQLLADPEYRRVCNPGGLIEFSAFGTDADTGLDIKARADHYFDGTVMDLKSAVDASPHGFARAVAAYKYHLQASHYLHMFEADRFVFVAIEKSPPYAHGVYTLDEASIEQGRIERRRALDGIAEHRQTREWPSYGVQELSLPNWAFDDEDIEVML